MQAELWATLMGLELAWANGYKKVIIETASIMVADMLQTKEPNRKSINTIAKKCQELLVQGWDVVVSHIHREANLLAGGITKWVFQKSVGYHLLEEPPQSVAKFLISDLQGVTVLDGLIKMLCSTL